MSVVSSLGLKLAGKTIMSGIQPTGVFHIGNLLGAVKGWVDMTREAPQSSNIVFMIADLHALTNSKAPSELRENRWKALASLMAAGLDPERCTIYFQSQVPAHSELHWILSSVSSMGYLNRMTQWKVKGENTANQSLALFSYPTLQAADILLHQSDFVPVGDDQAQHLELTRHLCLAFNHRFGDLFKEPSTVLTPYKRVLSLRDPLKKMSKSDPDSNSCIFITDTASEISRKLKRAVTDSVQGPIEFDPVNRPGVSNLALIGAGFEGIEPLQYLSQHQISNHAQLKQAVAHSVDAALSPIRERFEGLLHGKAQLESVAAMGAEKARASANELLSQVKQVTGL